MLIFGAKIQKLKKCILTFAPKMTQFPCLHDFRRENSNFEKMHFDFRAQNCPSWIIFGAKVQIIEKNVFYFSRYKWSKLHDFWRDNSNFWKKFTLKIGANWRVFGAKIQMLFFYLFSYLKFLKVDINFCFCSFATKKP